MKISQSLIEIYNVINQHMGSIEAKNVVSDILFNAISELQDNKLPVTEESLEELLSKKASDYIEVAKSLVA